MSNIQISVINGSSVLTDAEVAAVVPALQIQVHRDFAPVWGVDADLTFVASGGNPASGSWWLVILDNSDQAGALGYHDVTSEGLPLGKVFAATDQQYNEAWSGTASHELLEMLVDPGINLTVFVERQTTGGRLYAYEVCDACEADAYGYAIDGVQVSDFVYPAWFEAFRKQGSAQFDYSNQISMPFELLPGGYISIYDITAGSGWQQITAENAPCRYRDRPYVGSRRERRRTSQNQWLPSETHQGKKKPQRPAPKHR